MGYGLRSRCVGRPSRCSPSSTPFRSRVPSLQNDELPRALEILGSKPVVVDSARYFG